MKITWHERKNQTNHRKHGVRFELAQNVFDDEHCLTRQDRIEDGEQRWQTLGKIQGVDRDLWLVLLVAHTLDDEGEKEIVRIISARYATKEERRIYEAQTYSAGPRKRT